MNTSNYYITWVADYSVDVKEIDSQHKELLNVVNNALNHCTGDKAAERNYFDRIMKVGIKSLLSHFLTEEQMMKEASYENYLEHKSEHDKMAAGMNQIVNDIESGAAALDLLKITLFIRDWILNHIPQHDKKATEVFRRGISSPNVNT